MEEYQVATLSDDQLQKLKQLETELNTILIAYEDEDKELKMGTEGGT